MTITLPYPPSTNALYATFRNRRILSAEGRRYKLEVAAICLAKGIRPVDGDIRLTIKVYRPRKSGDLGNRLKVCEDSLSKIAYHDDKQVAELHMYRYDDKENPRCEVTIERIQAEAE